MERYKINKIGFLNYWLYDEEEFHFCDGKLLLRGGNGAGKTVTMVSAFPLLFDGNKNAERFDTFGSRDRKIEEYVLPSNSDMPENTSYIYMEFFRKDINKYLTIGIGLRAVKNRSMDFWGFALTDNRRIKDGFLLYKDHLNKIPLSKNECKVAVGTGGEFVTSQKEYKNMVNRLLFGYENASMYSELINLMLQLRSPKLSKEYKPTILVNILASVLDPISDADIQKMSDSIENMNQYKEKIDDLTVEYNNLNLLKNSFYDYSDVYLYHKASNYIKSNDKLKISKKNIEDIKTKIENLKENINLLDIEQKEINLEIYNIKSKSEELDSNNIVSLVDKKISLEKDVDELKEKLDKDKEIINKCNEKINDKNIALKSTEDELYIAKREYNIYYDEAKYNLENSNFSDLFKDKIEDKGISDIIKSKKDIINNLFKFVNKKDKLLESSKLLEDVISKEEDNIVKFNDEKIIVSKSMVSEIQNLMVIFNNTKNNQVFKLNDDNISDIQNILNKMDNNIYLVTEIFNKVYFDIKNDLNKAKNILDNKLIKEKGKLDVLNEQKLNIKNIFESNINDYERGEYAKSKGIECAYLYELIEFRDGIDISIRKNIENSLRALGLLQTLVIKNNSLVLPKTFGNLRNKNNSILKYFKIINKDYVNEVTDILNSIGSNIDDVYIDESGNYSMGIITGKVISDYDLKYIGHKERENYINKLTQDIDNEITIINNNIDDFNNDYQNILSNLNILENEKNQNISFDKYLMLIDSIKNIEQKINSSKEIIDSKKENIAIILDDVKKIEQDILLNKYDFNVEVNSNNLSESLNNLNELLDNINKMQTKNDNILHKQDIIDSIKSNIEDLEESIDNMITSANNNEALLNSKIKEIDKIQEELNKDENKDILYTIKNLKEEESRLENRNNEIIKERATAENELFHQEKDYKDEQENLNEEIIINKVLKDIFDLEYNLHYSRYQEPIEDFNEWFKNFKLEKNRTIDDANNAFYDRTSDHLFKLQNYGGKRIDLFSDLEDEAIKYTEDIKLQEKIKEILSSAKRKDLLFRASSGKSINILELSDNIFIELESNKELLSIEDRKLFEDLLLNNVGDSIREKIKSSNKWVMEVKSIMERMNTSSGLSFSLEWRGKDREAEEELDTKEIVDIFNASAQMVSESDQQRIVEHFRSKIRAEEEKYEKGEVNYIEIIKNVLDYRKWFQFKLYVKRANQDKKELTDKEFSKFSGGEKAIAMYIPLFAGINAKYNSARSDAPRVIALDEAFAGVDDVNILDSFRILSELDLDYILTSQMLWGDYESVKKLSIAELYHMPESDVISVIRYIWNGSKKNLVTSDMEYEEYESTVF